MWKLVLALATARCWSQLHHSITLPHAFVRVFSDPASGSLKNSEKTLKALCSALQSVDKALRQAQAGQDKEPLSAVQALADDLGTFTWVLTREILVDMEQADYNLQDDRLRELAWAIFASAAQTKSTCEDSFTWLKDSAKRQSTTDKMADETKWMYLQICPYASEGGSTTLCPPPADIRAQRAEDIRQYHALKPFAGQWHKLPFEDITKQQIKKWRPAGFFAQRRASAAAAFVLQHTQGDGLNIPAVKQAWCGGLEQQLHFLRL